MPSPEVLDLIEMIQLLPGPDPEVDALIATAVRSILPGFVHSAATPFTGSIDAAKLLVPAGYDYGVDDYGEDGGTGRVWPRGRRDETVVNTVAKTAATALVAASLIAIGLIEDAATGTNPLDSAIDHKIAKIMRNLSAAKRRNLLALPTNPGSWLTIAEMRGQGATGSGMDLLYTMFIKEPLCERRWAKWGGEPGQVHGEGYEYAITPLGVAVRESLKANGDASR